MIIYILLGLCCFFSFLNFIAVLFLSNFLFRIFVPAAEEAKKLSSISDGGLVDVKLSPTYDPRFRA